MIKHCAFYLEDHEYDARVYGLGPTEVDSKFTTVRPSGCPREGSVVYSAPLPSVVHETS